MNDKVKIARELIRIAKELKAGGGAGIDFRLKEFGDNDLIYQLVFDGSSITLKEVEGSIVPEKFSAFGYADGDDDVGAKYVFSNIEIDFDDVCESVKDFVSYYESKDWFVEALKKGNVYAEVSAIEENGSDRSILFAGWTRGILKTGDVVTFRHDCRVTLYLKHEDSREENIESVNYTMDFDGTLSENGADWYYDTFIAIPDDDDDDDWDDDADDDDWNDEDDID